MKTQNVTQSITHSTLLGRLEAELQQDPDCRCIERNAPILEELGLNERADVIAHDFCGGCHLFLGKTRKSYPHDLHRLRIQTDGLVHSGICVFKSVLIANEHTEEVKRLVRFLNTQEQEDGNLYNIKLMTWQDFGIVPDAM